MRVSLAFSQCLHQGFATDAYDKHCSRCYSGFASHTCFEAQQCAPIHPAALYHMFLSFCTGYEEEGEDYVYRSHVHPAALD